MLPHPFFSGDPPDGPSIMVIEDSDPLQSAMEFRRYRDRPTSSGQSPPNTTPVPSGATTIDEASVDTQMATAKGYRQGYLDASSTYLSSPLSELLPPQNASSAVPHSMRDFAMEYPYTTLATIGALGTFTLVSSAYITSRLFRRAAYGTPILSNSSPATGSAVLAGLMERRMDDLERRVVTHIQAANRDRKTDTDVYKRDILSSLSAYATAGADHLVGIEKKVESIATRIEAANRDRRNELHNFRSEIMGQLQVLEDQAKAQPEKNKNADSPISDPKVMAQIEAANRDRRSELHNFRAEVMGQLLILEEQVQGQRKVDQLKSESKILAQIEAANRDRRTELHNFRAEIMGQLQMMEAVANAPQRVSENSTAAKPDSAPSPITAQKQETAPVTSTASSVFEAGVMDMEAFEKSRLSILTSRDHLLETINGLEELTAPDSKQSTRNFSSQTENWSIFEHHVERANLLITKAMQDLWLAGEPYHDMIIHGLKLCQHDDFDSGSSEHECGYQFTERNETFLKGVNTAMKHFRTVANSIESYVVDEEALKKAGWGDEGINPGAYNQVGETLAAVDDTLGSLYRMIYNPNPKAQVNLDDIPRCQMFGPGGVEIPVKIEGPDSRGIYRYTHMEDGEEIVEEEDERGCHEFCPMWDNQIDRTEGTAPDISSSLAPHEANEDLADLPAEAPLDSQGHDAGENSRNDFSNTTTGGEPEMNEEPEDEGIEFTVAGPDSNGVYTYRYMENGQEIVEEVVDEVDERGIPPRSAYWDQRRRDKRPTRIQSSSKPSIENKAPAAEDDSKGTTPKSAGTTTQHGEHVSYGNTLQHLGSIFTKSSYGVDASRRWTFQVPENWEDIAIGSKHASLSFEDESATFWTGPDRSQRYVSPCPTRGLIGFTDHRNNIHRSTTQGWMHYGMVDLCFNRQFNLVRIDNRTWKCEFVRFDEAGETWRVVDEAF